MVMFQEPAKVGKKEEGSVTGRLDRIQRDGPLFKRGQQEPFEFVDSLPYDLPASL